MREDYEQFNPTRVVRTLVTRGLIHKQRLFRNEALALTREGFVMARRLGAVSEIVDLDRLQDGWRTELY